MGKRSRANAERVVVRSLIDEAVQADDTREEWREADEPSLDEWLDAQPTREAWLMRALHGFVVPAFANTGADAGIPTPSTRVSCGWTGSGVEQCTLGCTYRSECSADGTYEIFVSPTVADGERALAVLMHEYAHVLSQCTGHGEQFAKVCFAADLTRHGEHGLDSWPTCAYPSVVLQNQIASYCEEAGPYPHAALTPPPPTVVERTRATQTTRLLKASCSACGYVVRVTLKWASTGLPSCPCGAGAFTLEEKGETP